MSARQEESTPSFDAALFGMLVKKERLEQGCRTAEDLSAWVEYCTGVKIPKETIHRFENGKQEPKLSQALALLVTVYGSMPKVPETHEGMIDPISLSCSRQLKDAALHGRKRGYDENEVDKWLMWKEDMESAED